jgi:hypothetical protein
MYYATAVRGDHIWCDFSGGNYEGVDSQLNYHTLRDTAISCRIKQVWYKEFKIYLGRALVQNKFWTPI